jgi:hypothetical protein
MHSTDANDHVTATGNASKDPVDMVVDVMNNFNLNYQKKNQKQEKNQKKKK